MLHWLYGASYGDQVIKSVMATTYAKKRLSDLLMSLVSVIIRIHITYVCCILISFNPYVDFLSHTTISIFLVLKSHRILRIVKTQENIFFSVTEYFIKYYTPKIFRKWKRIVTLCISTYLIILLAVFPINNILLIICILQYVLCFFIVEQIEEQKYELLIERFKTREKKIMYEKVNVVEDYMDKDFTETDEEKIGFVMISNTSEAEPKAKHIKSS
jgi:hypothetical protein